MVNLQVWKVQTVKKIVSIVNHSSIMPMTGISSFFCMFLVIYQNSLVIKLLLDVVNFLLARSLIALSKTKMTFDSFLYLYSLSLPLWNLLILIYSHLIHFNYSVDKIYLCLISIKDICEDFLKICQNSKIVNSASMAWLQKSLFLFFLTSHAMIRLNRWLFWWRILALTDLSICNFLLDFISETVSAC